MTEDGFENAHSALRKAISNAANDAVRRYGEHGLTADQARTHAWHWVLDHGELVQTIMDDHERNWPAIIGRILKAECHRLGDAQRCARMGIGSWENFHYSTRAVEVAVRACFHPDGWMDAPAPEIPGLSFYQPTAPHSDWIVSMADVSRAMLQLSEQERLILEALYRADVPSRRLAKALSLPESSMSDRKEQILRKIVDTLGGPRPERQCTTACTHAERPLPLLLAT